MAEQQRRTRSMTRRAASSVAAAAASDLPAAAADTPAVEQHGALTRSRAAQQQAAAASALLRKRQRAGDVNSSTGGQVQQQQQQQAKKRRASVRQLAFSVMQQPEHPQAAEKLYPLLDSLLQADFLSDKHWKYSAAVYKVADEAPVPLLHALLGRPAVLLHILQTMHSHSSHQYIAQNAALTVLVLLRAIGGRSAAGPTPEAAVQLVPVLQLLLDDASKGLMLLLQAIHSSSPTISGLIVTGLSLFAHAVQTAGGPQAAAAMVDGLLAQGQQGLSLLLQALHHERLEDSTTNILRCMAFSAPPASTRLLDALLQQQHRRGLQQLVRALDSNSSHAATCARATCTALAQAGDEQQVQQLLGVLLRALKQDSYGAAQVVVSIAQTLQGPVQLQPHVKVLLQLVPKPGPAQTLIAAALWTVIHANEGAVAVLAAQDVTPLLQAMVGGGDSATLTAGAVCRLALSDAGKRVLADRVPEVLAAAQPQHSSLVASMAMRTIGILSAAGGPAWAQQAVLEHIGDVLEVLVQRQHTDAATAAGSIVLNLLQQPEGMDVLCKEQHLDSLLRGVQQRGPGMTYAARAVAQIVAAVPASRPLLAAAQRLEIIDGLENILQELLLADSEFLQDQNQAYAALAPVFWATVAMSACQIVPRYIVKLVQVLRGQPELTMPAFEAVTCMSSFQDGLLALAPHITVVQQMVSSERFGQEQGLQAYLTSMVANVESAVRQLRHEQAVVEGRLHYTAQQLAQVHARYRRRPRTKKLQCAVLLLAKDVGQLSEMNEALKQKLLAASGVATMSCV